MSGGLATIASIFTVIFGWIASLFMNHPKAFFFGIVLVCIFLYILYRLIFKDSMKSLGEALKSMARNGDHSSKISQLSSNRVTFKDSDRIAGLDKQLDEIYRQVTLPRSVDKSIKEAIGLRDSRGIIFHGETGTGKTMMARGLAEKIGCKSVEKVAASEIIEKYYGSSEENLRKLFTHEPGQLHMVILDEIDSICPVRSSGQHDSKFYTTLTNQLLSLMDGVDTDPDVIVVGTTNNIKSIDPAVLRPGRFDIHIKIPMPDEEARAAIFGAYTKNLINKGFMSEVDVKFLSRLADGFNGAEIENSIKKASNAALYRHKIDGEVFFITEEDIITAIESTPKH